MGSRSHADLWFMSWSCVQMWSHGSIIRKLMIDDFCPSEKDSLSLLLALSLPSSFCHSFLKFWAQSTFSLGGNCRAISHVSNDPFHPVRHIRRLCSTPAALVNTPVYQQTRSLTAGLGLKWCSGDSRNQFHWFHIATKTWFLSGNNVLIKNIYL